MSKVALAICTGLVIMCMIAGCGGGSAGTPTDIGSGDQIMRSASSEFASRWSNGFGGNGSNSRSIDPDWQDATGLFSGPRKARYEWTATTTGSSANQGCRRFAIGDDSKVYFHADQNLLACLNPDGTYDTGMSTTFTCDSPSTRFDSAPLLINSVNTQEEYAAVLCHVEPRANNTCFVAIYGTEGANKGVKLDDIEIGGNVATSPIATLEDYNSIFVVSRRDPTGLCYLHHLRWSGNTGQLTQIWQKNITTVINNEVSNPAYYVDPNGIDDLIFVLDYTPPVDPNGNPQDACVHIKHLVVDSSGGFVNNPPGFVLDDYPDEVPNLNSLVVDANEDFQYCFTTNKRLVAGYGGSMSFWFFDEDDDDGNITYSEPSVPAIMHDGLNGDETIFITIGYEENGESHSKLLGFQRNYSTLTKVFEAILPEPAAHNSATGYDNIGVAIDSENKIYVPAVNALYCFEPWPNGSAMTNTDYIWRFDEFGSGAIVQSPAIAPNGSVVVMSGKTPERVYCFGPGNQPDDMYEPLWSEWGYSDRTEHWNQRAMGERLPSYSTSISLDSTTVMPDCDYAMGTPATADYFGYDAIWVPDTDGTLTRVLKNGFTHFVDFTYDPTYSNLMPAPIFTSPAVSPDGGVVFGEYYTSYTRLENGVTTPTWSMFSGVNSGRFTSPCMVRDRDYGGMYYYIAETTAQNYKLKCVRDDGFVEWEHSTATPGVLEGTPCYVTRENPETGELEDTIFVQVAEYGVPVVWNVYGFDAHCGLPVYESPDILGTNNVPISRSTEERSVVYDDESGHLFMTTAWHTCCLSIPDRGGSVVTLPIEWSSLVGLDDCCGLIYDNDSVYVIGDYPLYEVMVGMDASTGLGNWYSGMITDRYEGRPITDNNGNIYLTTTESIQIYDPAVQQYPIEEVFITNLSRYYTVHGSMSFGNFGMYVPVYNSSTNQGELLCFEVY